ncbi:crescent membrane and immature virion formation protein [Western grey kangaroopox virus]|uniref:Crescent membrane and immature virion formation protein n=1 Tax=Western grey kangaroopox virus TaxID=1566307 RepID=A0A2C9DSM2_9POXV|nr:crescent membrane and immature virion formation protein [Western grey kangaroopox virus]ATI21005.1 crescent membrane and immature virion formation protein [Western grey kangaroopox virus]
MIREVLRRKAQSIEEASTASIAYLDAILYHGTSFGCRALGALLMLLVDVLFALTLVTQAILRLIFNHGLAISAISAIYALYLAVHYLVNKLT